MKKALLSLLVMAVVIILVAVSVFGGGGKVRGENGQGDVNQNQIMDPPPFQ